MTDTPPQRRVAGFDCDPPPWHKPAPDHRALINNHDFLADCSRYLEGIYTRAQVKKRWRNIDDATWDLLGADNALVDAIENMRIQRIRNGSCKREKAQLHIVAAPDILNGIMGDPKQSAKHRIDSAKTLNSLTGDPAEPEQRDMVIIKIDMGSDVRARGGTPSPNDVLIYEVTPNPNNTIDATPQELPPPRRGPCRPPGSKNKPKELLSITDDSDE